MQPPSQSKPQSQPQPGSGMNELYAWDSPLPVYALGWFFFVSFPPH